MLPMQGQRLGTPPFSTEPRQLEGVDRILGRADDRQIGQDLTRDRAEAEAVPRKSRRNDEARNGLRRIDHRQRVGRQIDQAAPCARNRSGADGGQDSCDERDDIPDLVR